MSLVVLFAVRLADEGLRVDWLEGMAELVAGGDVRLVVLVSGVAGSGLLDARDASPEGIVEVFVGIDSRTAADSEGNGFLAIPPSLTSSFGCIPSQVLYSPPLDFTVDSSVGFSTPFEYLGVSSTSGMSVSLPRRIEAGIVPPVAPVSY